LPDGWVPPWGWPRNGNVGPLWVKPEPATAADLQELARTGWTDPAKGTLVGTYNIHWHHPQYGNTKLELMALAPCETVPKYGGDGSWRYKSQHLPDRVDKVLCEGKWMHSLNDEMVRSKGGEPVEVIDLGGGAFENHELDLDITWDADLRLWRT
jgi:hypothetical protein